MFEPWLSHLLAVPPQASHLPPFSPLWETTSRLARKHGMISFSDCYLVNIMEMMLHRVDVRKALSRMPGTWLVPNKCYSQYLLPLCCEVWVREPHNNLQIAIYIHTKGEGNGNPLQYSCLENPMDKGAWKAIIHGVTKSQTWLKNSHTHTHTYILSHIISSSYWWWVGVLQGKSH